MALIAWLATASMLKCWTEVCLPSANERCDCPRHSAHAQCFIPIRHELPFKSRLISLFSKSSFYIFAGQISRKSLGEKGNSLNVKLSANMPACAAVGCHNSTDKVGPMLNRPVDASFHGFPLQDRGLLKQGLHNLNRKDFKPSKSSKLCSAHFLPDCFFEETKSGDRKRKKRALKESAVPTEFEHRTTVGESETDTQRQRAQRQERRAQVVQYSSKLLHMGDLEFFGLVSIRNVPLTILCSSLHMFILCCQEFIYTGTTKTLRTPNN